ncbi:MAG: hypothetical protein CMM01_23935 [Rhodopirellula sp.]|nr:hypothetical protein [Rhodopirellula sp.]
MHGKIGKKNSELNISEKPLIKEMSESRRSAEDSQDKAIMHTLVSRWISCGHLYAENSNGEIQLI